MVIHRGRRLVGRCCLDWTRGASGLGFVIALSILLVLVITRLGLGLTT